MARKYPAIDLIKLYARSGADKWNEWLSNCHAREDLAELAKTRYGIQAGMDDLVKKGMADEKLTLFFLRLNRSIENTIKHIIIDRNPLPHDNLVAFEEYKDEGNWLEQKRKRDREIELWLRKSAY